MFKKILFGILWVILTVIGIGLTVPYSLLEVIIDVIDGWTEKIEFNILDNGNNQEDKENGSNT